MILTKAGTVFREFVFHEIISVLMLFATSTIYCNSFWVLLRSQIVCSYIDDKVIKVTFQWKFDVCHILCHIVCHICHIICRSAEMLHYNFFVITRQFPSYISLTIYLRISHYSCNYLVFFALLFLSVMSEVYFCLS